MFASRILSNTALAGAALSAALLMAPAASAASYDQLFPGASSQASPQARAYYEPRPPHVTGTPRDYMSSHVCINGYRWITREYDVDDNPAEHAIPVRCD